MLIRPIFLYACGAWASTKLGKKRLLVFERKILRRIFGPERNEEENTYEQETNAELIALFNEPNIIATIKRRWISWSGHVSIVEGQTVHEITIRKPDEERPRQRWIDRDKVDLNLMGIRDVEQMTKDKEMWKGVVEVAMDI